MHAKLTPVINSSNIAGYGYFGGDLYVAFLTGSYYMYRSVPQDIYDGLTVASSKGKYVNAVIKNGGFEFVPLTEGDLNLNLAPFAVPQRSRPPRTVKGLDVTTLVLRYPFLQAAF